MIKATMVCSNCKKEEALSGAELREALEQDSRGEFHLCSDCSKLWSLEMVKLREERHEMFAKLQEKFGIKAR